MNPQRSLVVQVFLAQGRYHGAGAWPPSPARVFQALVAGAGPGQTLAQDVRDALGWLESLPAPTIHAPTARLGQKVQMYVPHNDLDTVEGGDPRKIESIRVGKQVQPYLFDARIPISYVWTFEANAAAEVHATNVCRLALGLYQLGRGVDGAWATASVLSVEDGAERIRLLEGETYRATLVGVPNALPEDPLLLDTPVPGTLEGLLARYLASARRFGVDRSQKKPVMTFSQPPRAPIAATPYGASWIRVLYELRRPEATNEFVLWRLEDAAELVKRLRDEAMHKLGGVFPERKADIENALLGRPVEGRAIPANQRVRIVPLPSIGHEHVDGQIRRVMVEIPAACPVAPQDVGWAFSGLELTSTKTGEVFAMLVSAKNTDMLRHYGMQNKAFYRWRTVTPVALGERHQGQGPIPDDMAQAMADALRHENIGAHVVDVRAQKTPFESLGTLAHRFAGETRFSETTLWHVEMTLHRAVRGPLVLGDGRYFGLGLFAPIREDETFRGLCYRVTGGLGEGATSEEIARALRRAVMARCGERQTKELATYVHGHEGPNPSRNVPHLHFQFDAATSRLWICAPHEVEHREWSKEEREHWFEVVRVMEGFTRLLAGRAGALDVRAEGAIPVDEVRGRSCVWENVSAYVANRHRKAESAHAALIEDVRQSLVDGGLPMAHVEVRQCFSTKSGLAGYVRLTFPVAVSGPILLGRSRFLGGGLFRAG